MLFFVAPAPVVKASVRDVFGWYVDSFDPIVNGPKAELFLTTLSKRPRKIKRQIKRNIIDIQNDASVFFGVNVILGRDFSYLVIKALQKKYL